MSDSVRLQALLKNAGISRFLLTRREKKALAKFIKRGETIEGCAKGYYAGGRGILVATDRKLLLLDTRLTSLYSRIIRYDRVSDIKFSKRFFDSLLTLRVDEKSVVFKSHGEAHLGRLSSYMRGKVLTIQTEEQTPAYQALLDKMSAFELKKQVLTPRHRHGKFSVSLQDQR